jgi:formimidoylglutamate deiminase
MYRFVDRLTPDHVEAIGALAFMEMLEAGYAAVGEFHYVHHQKGGTPYANPAELSHRICAAAKTTGIGLTHLPVLYTYGGAGKLALSEGQLRFANTVDQFCRLVERARLELHHLPADARMGIAPHSLRATSPESLRETLAAHPGVSIHMHIAEQPKEVQDIQAWLGARPVEWLLDHADVNASWCLVHATHMTATETNRMAASGAIAGLCPITEANLGDGPFNGAAYLNAGGIFGVGSDSNVQISMIQELRTLEYSQRLRDLARNVLVVGEGSVGHTLYTRAARGGAQALGRKAGDISIGHLADLVAIDSASPALCTLAQHQILDGLIFSAPDTVVTDVWSAGRRTVRNGRHPDRDAIIMSYRHAMTALLASI